MYTGKNFEVGAHYARAASPNTKSGISNFWNFKILKFQNPLIFALKNQKWQKFEIHNLFAQINQKWQNFGLK